VARAIGGLTALSTAKASWEKELNHQPLGRPGGHTDASVFCVQCWSPGQVSPGHRIQHHLLDVYGHARTIIARGAEVIQEQRLG
jgi:hypothetical protein